jgi:predicted amidohydrolase
MKTDFIQFLPEFGKAQANIEKALSMIEKADAELIISCD